MKLTLKIKLLPTDEQANLLLETMKEANTVCNAISDVGVAYITDIRTYRQLQVFLMSRCDVQYLFRLTSYDIQHLQFCA